jgi:hypothetical protein
MIEVTMRRGLPVVKVTEKVLLFKRPRKMSLLGMT